MTTQRFDQKIFNKNKNSRFEVYVEFDKLNNEENISLEPKIIQTIYPRFRE